SAGADRRFEGAFYRHWEMDALGTKANLPDLLASLLPDQIRDVHIRREERQALVDRYLDGFSGLPSIQTVSYLQDGVSAHHLFPVAVPSGQRDRVLNALNEAKIGATVNYRAVHRMEYYANKYQHPEEAFPVAFDWGQRTLSLPLFPGLRQDEQDYVIQRLADILSGPEVI
ncbi:MAG: DegT/DnrJ/EryC1/StrS family aminotransferase, partial [Pseudomonadota bacterium]